LSLCGQFAPIRKHISAWLSVVDRVSPASLMLLVGVLPGILIAVALALKVTA